MTHYHEVVFTGLERNTDSPFIHQVVIACGSLGLSTESIRRHLKESGYTDINLLWISGVKANDTGL